MAINPDFLVAAVDLSEVFVDKDTGQPLSGGQVSFFRDADRVTAKNVYTIENNNPGLPPVYTYVALPNPITLNATGQFQDNAGNNIPVYYYPVDAAGQLDLYYIVVTNSSGTQQFIRQAWPPNESSVAPPPVGLQGNNFSNQLTNSQFLFVNFPLLVTANPPEVGYTFNYVGAATDTINIAPGWNLVVVHNGNGSITIARKPIAGNAGVINNPPYTLVIRPGANITSLQLVQRFPNNPDVFSPLPGAGNGWISASILLANNSQATISYQTNAIAAQQLLNANNNTGGYFQFQNTVQLTPAANPANGDTGFINIIVTLPNNLVSELSNLQIIPLNTNIQNVPYDQRTSNREQDFTFNYWNQFLKAKPIKSYLIGWDFPLNPTQVTGNGTIGAQATGGAAGSFQAWDQTVVFQSATNAVTIARSASGSGAMTLTANAVGVQVAVIQYLPQALAREILQNPLSSQFTGLTNIVAGLNGTISLWYTANPALPSTAANLSLVTALDATGHPSAVVAGWNEVPRGNLGPAQFLLGTSATTDWNDYGFAGWNLNGAAAVNTATFFAIVVGFGNFSSAGPDTIDVGAISLIPGNIPTRPAPQTANEVLKSCELFYEKTFITTRVPANNAGLETGDYQWSISSDEGGNRNFDVQFRTQKNAAPTTITLFNPSAGNVNQMYNYRTAASFTNCAAGSITANSFLITGTIDAGGATNDRAGIHWTADARLGV